MLDFVPSGAAESGCFVPQLTGERPAGCFVGGRGADWDSN